MYVYVFLVITVIHTHESNFTVMLQREAEHRENIATTIRALRGNESQQTIEIVFNLTHHDLSCANY